MLLAFLLKYLQIIVQQKQSSESGLHSKISKSVILFPKIARNMKNKTANDSKKKKDAVLR